jgi:molybdopterin synthase sulfur carrier subunit
MRIKVRPFAGFRHVLGREIELDLPEGARVADLLQAICLFRPAMCSLLLAGEELKADVNVFVAGKNIASLQGLQTLLVEEDEVALFPAVIGG